MFKLAYEILSETILPYVFGVHGLDVPYPAQLIRQSGVLSSSGSVVFRLDKQGRVAAEYFAYGSTSPGSLHVEQSRLSEDISVHILDTGVVIPVQALNRSDKTATIYFDGNMPHVMGFEGVVYGWVGDPSVKMQSAVVTLEGCAVMPFRTLGSRSFLDVGEGDKELAFPSYYESRKSEIVKLTAGGWGVSIHSSSKDVRDNLSDEPPYSISITRSDRSHFQLSWESDVLHLLNLLLSFSSERWITFSTIHGRKPGAHPDVVERAFVGYFASRGWTEKRDVSRGEFRDWPVIFKTLWQVRESPLMKSALNHLISCGDRSKGGSLSYQDLVDASGALEAAVRLWNNLDPTHFFRARGSHSLVSQLRRVVSEFRMDGRKLDERETIKVVRQALEYRHPLAHGNGGEFYDFGDSRWGKVMAHQQYLYYLARLLILAKLGGSSGHPGFLYFAPKLIDA